MVELVIDFTGQINAKVVYQLTDGNAMLMVKLLTNNTQAHSFYLRGENSRRFCASFAFHIGL